MAAAPKAAGGFTLLELLIAVTLAALLLTAIAGLIKNALGTEDIVAERNRLASETRFALERMVSAARQTPCLVLPTPDRSDTDWRENVREQTVPPSPPEGSSTNATAVLAVCLSRSIDLDADGFPDADNDRDGRVDEDFPADNAFDNSPGIHLIDDGGDGTVDESTSDSNDDEHLNGDDEDPMNSVDDDGDGVLDEDTGADMNADGAPGYAGVDDDGDGQVDEGGDASDDDEDGSVDEDWMDVVVFHLQGDSLIERHPVPWDETASGGITGRDFVESVIAEGVTRFRVERSATVSGDKQLVDLTLELAGATGAVVSLSTRVRVGGAL